MAYQKNFIGPLVWKCFTNDLSYFERKLKFDNFFPGEVRVRQNDIEKIMAYQKIFIGPLVWKCFTNDLSYFELFMFERKLKFDNFFPGEVRVRQNDIEKIMAYQKIFIGPLVWKCSTNDFELLLSEN